MLLYYIKQTYQAGWGRGITSEGWVLDVRACDVHDDGGGGGSVHHARPVKFRPFCLLRPISRVLVHSLYPQPKDLVHGILLRHVAEQKDSL
jgi:hypothetical protein